MKTNRSLRLIRATFAPIVAGLAVSTLAQSPFVRVIETGDLGQLDADSGASWGDYDNDGDVDLFVPNWGRRLNYLYRNDGNGVFTVMTTKDAGELAGNDDDASMGVWADIDNDGDCDLYLAVFTDGSDSNPAPAGPDVIYLNNGRGQFERQTPSAFSGPARFSACASLFDYDRDGLLDVFITTWPTSGPGADVLYHNEGGLRFSSAGSFTPATAGLLGLWGDVDEDGDYDLIVGDYRQAEPSLFHMNQAAQGGPSAFIVSTTFPNGTRLPNRLSDADWGDYDNDGDLDLLAGHTSHAGCDLFRNDGGGAYTRIAIPLAGNEHGGGVVWVDVDNDGRLDILLSSEDPSRGNYRLAYSYLRNEGGGGFQETVIVSDVEFLGNPFLPNPGDFDNDGDMDFFLVVASEGENPDQLWRNEGNTNHWLKLVLKGTVSNASAIGAIVRVKATIRGQSEWQMRQVFAGGKFLAQTDPRPNFGLGDATIAEVVRIEWPSGTVQELTNVVAGQLLTVIEPPRLQIELGGHVSWPVTADGYRLESATSINGPWAEGSELVRINGSRQRIRVQPDGRLKFYRLSGQ